MKDDHKVAEQDSELFGKCCGSFAKLSADVRSGKLVLETDRLWLREFVADDAEAYFALNSDPEVMRYLRLACPTSVEQARKEIRERPIRDYQKFGFGRWAVVLKGSSKLIGFAGLKYLDDLGEVDLGYRLMAAYWGQGLATEASRACVNHGFQALGLKKIVGLVDPENTRSVRVLEKSGLLFEQMIDYQCQQVARYGLNGLDGIGSCGRDG